MVARLSHAKCECETYDMEQQMRPLTLKEAIADHGDHLAKEARVRIETLEAALRRIVEATPFNTNSATPQRMASWTRAVAATALEDGSQP